jgi:hypothetical protein
MHTRPASPTTRLTERHPINKGHMMPIRHRCAAALAAATMALVGLAAFSTNASAQTATPVQQGRTVNLGSIDPFLDNFTVDPVAAGTVAKNLIIPPSQGGENYEGTVSATLSFTASTSYLGPATIRQSNGTAAFSVLVGGSASVGATFTPKAAPGPCIQIVSGATVPLGEIEIGSDSALEAPTRTQVRSCAPINTKLNASVSAATSGVTPNVVTMQPSLLESGPLGPNKFQYQIASRVDPTSSEQCPVGIYWADLTNLPRLIKCFADLSIDFQLTPGTTREIYHRLWIGAGSSGAGQEFSTTVTLTAMAA